MKLIQGIFLDKQGNINEHIFGIFLGWTVLHLGILWNLYHGGVFDPTTYSIGFGGIGALGATGQMLSGSGQGNSQEYNVGAK